MAGLYQQLGCSELKAWYHTLLESSEFDHIEPFVTEIVKQQQHQPEPPAVSTEAQEEANDQPVDDPLAKSGRPPRKTARKQPKRNAK